MMEDGRTKKVFGGALALLFLASIAYTQVVKEGEGDKPGEPSSKVECDLILLAPACIIPEQVPQTRPLPEGCICPDSVTGWDASCWLSGREASAAQDLGTCNSAEDRDERCKPSEAMDKDGKPVVPHYWRILAEDCDATQKQKEFYALAPDFKPKVASAAMLEVKPDGKVELKGGYSGRPAVEVAPTVEAIVEAQRLKAEAASAAAEMMNPKPKVDAGSKSNIEKAGEVIP